MQQNANKRLGKKALGDQLGLPGTPAADILSKLGKPDELTPTLDHSQVSVQTMPGKLNDYATVSLAKTACSSNKCFFLRPSYSFWRTY